MAPPLAPERWAQKQGARVYPPAASPTETTHPATTWGDVFAARDWPTGVAYVEQVGWEEDKEHGRRFIARLVFPTGAPDLTAAVVWQKRRVRIEVQNGDQMEL